MEKALEQLKQRIDALLGQKAPVLVAIEGHCAAGKTTLAGKLQQMYDCNVFHMDDFFLRPEQRTPERYAQPGGNVDHERFAQEVLLPLQGGAEFSYRPFDCKTFTLKPPVNVPLKQLNIIEGSYSQHPCFGEPYDLKIFLGVTPRVQEMRILQRPAFLHQRFFAEWIPMENRYFEHFSIAEKSHIRLQLEN